MQTKILHAPRFLRQRKFFLVLPLLIVPFLVLLFLALGGGRTARTGTNEQAQGQGLNLQLPDAHFTPGREKDKMDLYESMRRDTVPLQEQIPEVRPMLLPPADTLGDAVRQRLDLLKAELSRGPAKKNGPAMPAVMTLPAITDLHPLPAEAPPSRERDPELAGLDSLLDKVLQVQAGARKATESPELSVMNTRKQITPDSGQRVVLRNPDPMYFGADSTEVSGGFFPAAGPLQEQDTIHANLVEAVIDGPQILLAGTIVCLQLLQPVFLPGLVIPAGQRVYATAALRGERLLLTVTHIRIRNHLETVSLSAYDLDGQEGLAVPGSMQRESG